MVFIDWMFVCLFLWMSKYKDISLFSWLSAIQLVTKSKNLWNTNILTQWKIKMWLQKYLHPIVKVMLSLEIAMQRTYTIWLRPEGNIEQRFQTAEHSKYRFRILFKDQMNNRFMTWQIPKPNFGLKLAQVNKISKILVWEQEMGLILLDKDFHLWLKLWM